MLERVGSVREGVRGSQLGGFGALVGSPVSTEPPQGSEVGRVKSLLCSTEL